jgi:hypothetical protein
MSEIVFTYTTQTYQLKYLKIIDPWEELGISKRMTLIVGAEVILCNILKCIIRF